MAHKNVNLIWREPLMGDLRLIELFLCCDICGWDGICVCGGRAGKKHTSSVFLNAQKKVRRPTIRCRLHPSLERSIE